MELAYHSLTRLPDIAHRFSYLDDGATVFMPHDNGRVIGEFVVIDVQIGAADATIPDADEEILRAWLGRGYVAQGYMADAWGIFEQGAHA